MRRSTIALLTMLLACSRKTELAGSDAAADGALVSIASGASSVSVPGDARASAAETTASAPDSGFERAAVLAMEAERMHVASFREDPRVATERDLLALHYNGPEKIELDLQTAPLTAAHRRVVLATVTGTPTLYARAIAYVVDDAAKKVLWAKDHPVAGIKPPVGPTAIAAGPHGRVALAACDPPTSTVALRIWDEDGAPFADFQALSVDACGALSLMYWPRHGWVVVVVRAGATRAQLVKEGGSPGWAGGLDLGVRPKDGAIAPAGLAADTDDTFVLVQLAQPTGEAGSPFHALAFRYDAHGTAIWPAAVDLGALPKPPLPGERAQLHPTLPGVSVMLPSGPAVSVRPSGDVSRGRAPR